LELRRLLREHRIRGLSHDGLEKAAAGITDIKEVNQMSCVEFAEDACGIGVSQLT
jgi:hypothetical protein